MPGRFAARRQMVSACQALITQNRTNGVRGDISQKVGPGRYTVLVVDYLQLVAFLCQPQHGLGEIAATRRINPGSSEDQMLAAGSANVLFAGQLGVAIGVQRGDVVVLAPGSSAFAIED